MRSLTLLRRFLPIAAQLEGYDRRAARYDLVAGITVALVLIPQSMAYAQLAGLPAYYGLYAACIPPVVASLFGSSAQLATGPVAVVSLMTATALEPLAQPGSERFIAYAIALALMVGVLQLALGLLRLGAVVNLLSHPVVNGFTNAAALIIASSQLATFLGVSVEKGERHYETVLNVCRAATHHLHWPTLAMGAGALLVMIVLRRLSPRLPGVLVAVALATVLSWATGYERNLQLAVGEIGSPSVRELVERYLLELGSVEELGERRRRLVALLAEAEERAGGESAEALDIRHRLDLLALELREASERAARVRRRLRRLALVGVRGADGRLRLYLRDDVPSGTPHDGRVWRLRVGSGRIDPERLVFQGGGAVVGAIPRGLPALAPPVLEPRACLGLLPMVAIISVLGFMEAISIAKAMAARTGQRLDPNRELVGQGLANIVGSFARSYPVSGSFSRSAVNLQAGARTGLSNVFASAVVLVTLLFLTPLLYHLPQSVLAAVIMMAVIGLVDFTALVEAWRAQPHDGLIAGVTFVVTLVEAPHLERGIFLGVALSLGLYLFRTMKPDVALLALYTDGSYRNAARLGLDLCRRIAVIRFNGSLFFSNVSYLEDQVLERVAAMPDLRHVLLVGNGINEIDASGVETLRHLVERLREAGYAFSVSGLNDAVREVVRRTGLERIIGPDNIFPSVRAALERIWEPAHEGCDEEECPLVTVRFRGLEVAAGARRRPEILAGPPGRRPG